VNFGDERVSCFDHDWGTEFWVEAPETFYKWTDMEPSPEAEEDTRKL
jgi:hypothetical protein